MSIHEGQQYTVAQIAEERRTQEQCFLLHWLEIISAANRHINYSGNKDDLVAGTPGNSASFYPIDGDPAKLVSVLTGKMGLGPLLTLSPYKMSYLVPKVRLYKVFKEYTPRTDTDPGGALEKEYDVEFIFPDNILGISQYDYASGESGFSKIERMLTNKVGRGTGVGLQEFSWEYQGTNPAEATNQLLSTISLTFSDLQELYVKRGPVPVSSYKDGTGQIVSESLENVYYSYIDLIMRTVAGDNDASASENATDKCMRYRSFDPKYYEIKALVGWAYKDGHPFTVEEREALESSNIGLYLTLVDHVISFQEDGTVKLDCTYRAAVEGLLDSDFTDLFTSPYERARQAQIEAAMNAIRSGSSADVDEGVGSTSNNAGGGSGGTGRYTATSTETPEQGATQSEQNSRALSALQDELERLRNDARGMGFHQLAQWLANSPANSTLAYERRSEDYMPLHAGGDSSARTATTNALNQMPRIKYIMAKPLAVGATGAADEDVTVRLEQGDRWGDETVTEALDKQAVRYDTSGNDRALGPGEHGSIDPRTRDMGQATDWVREAREEDASDNSSTPADSEVGFYQLGTDPQAPIDQAGILTSTEVGGDYNLTATAGIGDSLVDASADSRRYSQNHESSNSTIEYTEDFEQRLDLQATRPVLVEFTDSAGNATSRLVYPTAFVYYGDIIDWACRKALWIKPYDADSQYPGAGGAGAPQTSVTAARAEDERVAATETAQSAGWTQGEDGPAPSLPPVDEFRNAAREGEQRLKQIKVILGSLRYYNPSSGEYQNVNLADIPVSYNMFATWFMNRIMRPGVYSYSLRTFIKETMQTLILDVLGGTSCIDDTAYEDPNGGGSSATFTRTVFDIGMLNVQVPNRSMGADKPSVDPISYIWSEEYKAGQFGSSTAVHQNANYRLSLDRISTYIGKNADNTDRAFPEGLTYCDESYIGNMTTYYIVYAKGYNVKDLRGVETKEEADALFPDEGGSAKYADNEKGIYHFYIGQNAGMVKSVSFNRTDQAYLAEARMMAGGHFGYGQLRGRYEASIIMHGNTFFLPGQMIYINPTTIGSGNMYERRLDALLLGLGGYYVVLGVDSSITEDTFETRLRAVWHGMGSYFDGNDWVVLNCGESTEDNNSISTSTAYDMAETAMQGSSGTHQSIYPSPDGDDNERGATRGVHGDTGLQDHQHPGHNSREVDE